MSRRAERLASVAVVVLAAASCATTDPIAPQTSGGGGAASAGASGASSGSSGTSSKAASASASGATSSATGGSSCGDAVLDPGEECDDGNTTSADGCTSCVVDCEVGAQKYVANHHCYRVFATSGAEAAAEAACESWGGAPGLGHLVSVSDAAEQAFVMTLVTADGWMGGGDAATEAQYVWYDGTPFTYTHWAPNEPNDTGHLENCMYMQATGGWDDHSCVAMQPSYICERGAAGAP